MGSIQDTIKMALSNIHTLGIEEIQEVGLSSGVTVGGGGNE
jgi:hypothetical protein